MNRILLPLLAVTILSNCVGSSPTIGGLGAVPMLPT